MRSMPPTGLHDRHSSMRALLLAVLVLPLASWAGLSSVGPAGAAPDAATVAGCSVFPADNVWNARVDGLDNPNT